MKSAEVTQDDIRLTDEALLAAVFAEMEPKSAREEADLWIQLHAEAEVDCPEKKEEKIYGRTPLSKRAMFAAAAMTAIAMTIFAVDTAVVAERLKLEETAEQLFFSQQAIIAYAEEMNETAAETSEQYLAKLEAEHLEEELLRQEELERQQNQLQNRDYIERVVAAEARGEPFEGMMAVAQVISDRAELWGMTPYEVVTQRSQFAPPYQGAISDEVKLAVSKVFDEGTKVFEEPVTHFYSGSAVPYWTASKVNRGSVGRHKFWY